MVATPVVSSVGGATVTLILVLLSTVTLETGTTLPSEAVMLTGVTGQVAVALADVVKLVPVMATLSYVLPANQVLGLTAVMVGLEQP